MTRKHYNMIAASFYQTLQSLCDERERFVVTTAIYDMADALQRDNPRFDRDRFISACTKGK